MTFSIKDSFIFVQWRWTEKDSGDEVDGIKNNVYGSHYRIFSFKLPWPFESEAFRWHIDRGQHQNKSGTYFKVKKTRQAKF